MGWQDVHRPARELPVVERKAPAAAERLAVGRMKPASARVRQAQAQAAPEPRDPAARPALRGPRDWLERQQPSARWGPRRRQAGVERLLDAARPGVGRWASPASEVADSGPRDWA